MLEMFADRFGPLVSFEIVGSDVVNQNGGTVNVIQFVEGYSTTKIEEKIKNS